jgi:hypothetical protein
MSAGNAIRHSRPSRDHHQALVVSQRLRRAGDHGAGEAQAAFLEFWRSGGELHFRVEEEVLLPRFAVAGGAHTAPVARVLIEHAEIRLRVLRLQGGAASAAVLRSSAACLPNTCSWRSASSSLP